MSVLNSLHRLRSHLRQQSSVQLKTAEVERDQQQQRVQDIEVSVVQAQKTVDTSDLNALTEYHGWRLRQELAWRRESARLHQRQRDVEIQKERHIRNVRDELAMQNVLQAKELVEQEEDKRKEARWMDEIASRRKP